MGLCRVEWGLMGFEWGGVRSRGVGWGQVGQVGWTRVRWTRVRWCELG